MSNYVTFSDLFALAIMIIALLTYLNDRNNKQKNNRPVTLTSQSNY